MSSTAAIDLQTALFGALTNDAGVSAAVGGRVLDNVPQGTAYPLVVIGDVVLVNAGSFGSDDREAQPEIQIWAEDGETTTASTGAAGFKTAEQIAALVRGVIMGSTLTISGYAGVTVLDNPDEHTERIAVTDALLCRCIKQTYRILLEDS